MNSHSNNSQIFLWFTLFSPCVFLIQEKVICSSATERVYKAEPLNPYLLWNIPSTINQRWGGKNYSTDGFGNFSRGTLKKATNILKGQYWPVMLKKDKGVEVTLTSIKTVMRNPISDMWTRKDEILKTHVWCFTKDWMKGKRIPGIAVVLVFTFTGVLVKANNFPEPP